MSDKVSLRRLRMTACWFSLAPRFSAGVWRLDILLIPQRGLIIQPRVAAWPLPWVRYQDEFPSLKGMNTGFVIYPLLGNGKVVLLLSQGSGFTATLGCFI